MKKPQAPRAYAPGYFSEPVRAWTSMRFESQLIVDPKTKRFITDYARAQQIRQSGGWNVNRLNLPGSMA